MSDTKFTPGPWSVFIDDSGDRWSGWPLSINAKKVHEDCMVVRTGGQWPYEWDFAISQIEAVANAHLIAAAPELYEALYIANQHAPCELYAKALAKARGEV